MIIVTLKLPHNNPQGILKPFTGTLNRFQEALGNVKQASMDSSRDETGSHPLRLIRLRRDSSRIWAAVTELHVNYHNRDTAVLE